MSVADEAHLKMSRGKVSKKFKKKLFLFSSSKEVSFFLYPLKKYLLQIDPSLSIDIILSFPVLSPKEKFPYIISFFNSKEDFYSFANQLPSFLPWAIILETPPSNKEALESSMGYFQKPLYVQDIALWIEEKIFPFLFQENAPPSEKVSIGCFLFDPLTRRLTHQKTLSPLSLTEKETLLLGYLIEKKESIVLKEDLLEKIWEYKKDKNISTRTLESHIYSLRKKLEDNPSSPKILLTEKGGYRLHIPPKIKG